MKILGDAGKDKCNGSLRVYYECECGYIGSTRKSRALKQKWCAKCNREKNQLKTNEYRIDGDIVYVDVSTEKFPDTFCKIDLKNKDLVLDGKGRWFASNFSKSTIYVVRKSICEKIHRLILNADDKTDVDHEDGDGLNNLESNLKTCSTFENMQNRAMSGRNKSGFNGVSWHKANKKWHVQAGYLGVRYNLGFYENIDDAIAARKEFNLTHKYSERHGKKK